MAAASQFLAENAKKEVAVGLDARVLQGVHNPEGFPPNDAILPRCSGPEVSALNAEILRGSPEVSAKNFGGVV
jgi:hypothetical protein